MSAPSEGPSIRQRAVTSYAARRAFRDAVQFTEALSPLLGVDPLEMAEAIRAVGCDHVTLSSDAGEPLFPNSVECTVTNPRLILGLG